MASVKCMICDSELEDGSRDIRKFYIKAKEANCCVCKNCVHKTLQEKPTILVTEFVKTLESIVQEKGDEADSRLMPTLNSTRDNPMKKEEIYFRNAVVSAIDANKYQKECNKLNEYKTRKPKEGHYSVKNVSGVYIVTQTTS